MNIVKDRAWDDAKRESLLEERYEYAYSATEYARNEFESYAKTNLALRDFVTQMECECDIGLDKLKPLELQELIFEFLTDSNSDNIASRAMASIECSFEESGLNCLEDDSISSMIDNAISEIYNNYIALKDKKIKELQ